MSTKLIQIFVVLTFFLTACISRVETYQEFSKLPEPLPGSEGQLIFEESKCIYCHGIQGDGNGFLSDGLKPEPTDFTIAGLQDSKVSERWEKAILRGVEGTSMPSFPNFTPNQIRKLTDYLHSLSGSNG